MEEQRVHVPESVLQGSRLGRRGRGEGVGVDLREGEMTKGELDAAAQSSLDALDCSKSSPRIGAFVVAVLEDDTTGRCAPDVIDLVEWRDHAPSLRAPMR